MNDVLVSPFQANAHCIVDSRAMIFQKCTDCRCCDGRIHSFSWSTNPTLYGVHTNHLLWRAHWDVGIDPKCYIRNGIGDLLTAFLQNSQGFGKRRQVKAHHAWNIQLGPNWASVDKPSPKLLPSQREHCFGVIIQRSFIIQWAKVGLLLQCSTG